MKTIRQAAIGSTVVSHEDMDPYIGVSDNHLLVSSRPSAFGVFVATSGDLPTQPARSFRLTNAGSSNIAVTHRVPLLQKYFDGDSLEVSADSGSIVLSNPNISTPNGYSNVLKIAHTADNSAYANIPAPFGLQLGYTASNYFKITTNTTQLQPLGLYSNFGGIDINHPAVGLRVNSDNTWRIRVGTTETTPTGTHVPGDWYRVRITAAATSATVVVDKYNATTKLWANVVNETETSSGVGLIDELLTKDNFTIAFAAEGAGVQYIDNFELLSTTSAAEVLLPNTTKEYHCDRSLDEYSVDGAISGYYRG